MNAKTELTPERLVELANWHAGADCDTRRVEKIMKDSEGALLLLAEILRKSDPIYQVVIHGDPDGENYWADCSESFYKAFQPDDVKRIVYTAPQPVRSVVPFEIELPSDPVDDVFDTAEIRGFNDGERNMKECFMDALKPAIEAGVIRIKDEN